MKTRLKNLLFCLICSVGVNAVANDYDRAETIRRDAERLDRQDQYERQQAKDRYDSKNESGGGSSSILGSLGTIAIVGGFIFYLFMSETPKQS